MKKGILLFSLIFTFLFNFVTLPIEPAAYSYGDPSEEKIALAYNELVNHLDQNNWDKAKEIYQTYEKDFDLYFKKTIPDIEKALETKDKELLKKSWQAAMRLNIERRLHFAEEQVEDYGQAKLLLAKARGTFTALDPLLLEKTDQATVDSIYKAFDVALESLGNPGLFGIGNQQNDPDTFMKQTQFISKELEPHFPIVSEESDKSHLTEENLDLLDNIQEGGSSSFWLILSVVLIAFLMIMILFNKRKQKKNN